MRRFSTSLACVIVAGVFSGATVQAQTITTGAVTGKVTDSAGLPLSGAIVRATSGQIVRTVTTNAEGSFVVSLLNGGNWNLQITKAGYTTGSKAVQVMVNTTTPTHFKLAKEGVATVEVVATSSTIDSSSTTTGSTFALDTISSLPVGRDLANIAFLTPGVTTSGFSSTNGLNIAIAGASGAENSYSVDGLQTNDMRYGGQGASLINEFIDQADIQTGGFKPEYSALGGVFNVTTKSGSNQFQGSSWAYLAPSSLKPAAKSNLYYGESTPTTVYDIGAWVGGPILKDKLFYSVGLDYQHTSAASSPNASGDNVGADKIPNVQFIGKINYYITPENQLTLSIFGNDQTDSRENTAGLPSDQLTGRGNAYSGRDIKNSTSNFNLIWDSMLSSNMNISVKAGRSQIDYKQIPASNTSRIIDYTYYTTGPDAGLAWVTGGGGISNDHEVNKTNQFSADLNWIVGDHVMKFGYSYQDSVYKIDETYAGGETWYIYSATDARARVYINHSNAKATFQGIYAQDGWQITRGLNAYYGFRMEQQEQKAGSDGHTFLKFKFLDYIQPRLGFTWDAKGDGQSKLSGSFGQYYEKIPQRIAVRTYGNEYYHRFKYDTFTYNRASGTVTNVGPVLPGGDADYSSGWSNDPIQDGLKLPKRIEFTLGYDQQISATTALGIHAKYRKMTNIIEDSVLTDYAGGTLDTSDQVGQAILWNPHKGSVSWTNTSGQKVTVNNTLLPEAYNEYKSIDVSYTRKTANNLIYVSYTRSRNYGTYEGLISPSNGQADGNITASFDYWPYVGTGLLPTDHTHCLKAYGYQKFNFGASDVLTFGFNFQVQSGSPYSYKDDGSTSNPTLPDPGQYGNSDFQNLKMGNKGRTPTTKKLDINVQYSVHLGPKVTLEPMLEISNLTNCRVATQVVEESMDQNGVAYPVGQWGSPLAYQAARSFRFGARLKF